MLFRCYNILWSFAIDLHIVFGINLGVGYFLKHVPGLSVKPLSTKRWECRIDSVKAIHYQVGEVYDALVEISEITNEQKVKAEAEL